LANRLAEFFKLKKTGAGTTRRAFANRWKEFVSQKGNSLEVWRKFMDTMDHNPDKIEAAIAPYLDKECDTQTLGQFNQDQVNYDRENKLETIPDIRILRNMVHDQQGVFDGKLAVIAEYLSPRNNDFDKHIFEEFPELAIPMIQLVLTCSDDDSAKRVWGRDEQERIKNGLPPTPPEQMPAALEVTRQANHDRIENDWQRYEETYNHKLYERPVRREDIRDPETSKFLIDTSSPKTKDQVFAEALKHIRDHLINNLVFVEAGIAVDINNWVVKIDQEIVKIQGGNITSPTQKTENIHTSNHNHPYAAV
jgi:hypothetical protein